MLFPVAYWQERMSCLGFTFLWEWLQGKRVLETALLRSVIVIERSIQILCFESCVLISKEYHPICVHFGMLNGWEMISEWSAPKRSLRKRLKTFRNNKGFWHTLYLCMPWKIIDTQWGKENRSLFLNKDFSINDYDSVLPHHMNANIWKEVWHFIEKSRAV